jgi:hypothetical protein
VEAQAQDYETPPTGCLLNLEVIIFNKQFPIRQTSFDSYILQVIPTSCFPACLLTTAAYTKNAVVVVVVGYSLYQYIWCAIAERIAWTTAVETS